MRSFATVTGVVGLFGLLAGCAAQTGSEDVASGSAELSKSKDSFVSVSQPECFRAPCPAYIVQDVNKSTASRAIGNLDFSSTCFTKQTISEITSAPASEIVLKGHLGPVQAKTNLPSFIVTDAYRGLPGDVYDASSAVFYRAADFSPPVECFVAPCPEGTATKLNTSTMSTYDSIDVTGAAPSLVSQAWLTQQIAFDDAIVAGSIVKTVGTDGRATTALSPTQVFLRMPAGPAACPEFKLAACPDGQVRSYSRDANLCELPGDCVPQGICPLYRPACPAGYTETSWVSAPNGCLAFGCDPTFVAAQ